MLAEFIQLPREGETVGPYVLRRTLSSSILGSFYIATNKSLHEDVLLHIIPEALLRADNKFQARYREIVERQRKLGLETVLTPLEMSRISGNLVVQYSGANYKSLNEIILKRRDPLPTDSVRHLLKTVAGGLAETTKIEQGHYFLTPDFLFLNNDGDIRVAGVGLFQSIQYEAFERFVSGAVIPIQFDKKRSFEAIEILSPEIRNFKSRDLRSDFYCLGMCAYFMLTGYKPERKWSLPSKVRKDIDPGWDLFISHCLEPKPADRFQHYRAYLRDLDHIEDLTGSPRREGGQLLRILHQIPLPKAFERMFSLRTQLFIRLSLLGLAGFLAVGTASIFHQIIFSDFNETDQPDPIRQVERPDKANLVVRVSPPHALVVVSGPENGRFIVHGDPLLLDGRSGRYTLEVSAPRRKSQRIEFDLVASDPVLHEVDLDYQFSGVRIDGAVGTEVYVEETPGLPLHIGTIESEDGLLVDNRLLAGRYVFVGRNPSYLPARTERLEIKGAETAVTLEQSPRPTELIVTSEPVGALVYVEGVPVGLTPLRLEGLEAGKGLKILVEKDGYRPFLRTIELARGERLALDAGELAVRVGTFNYTFDQPMEDGPPVDAFSFTLNGEAVELNAEGRIPLEEGTYSLLIEHADFYPFEAKLSIRDRDETHLRISPEPRPLRVKPVIPERMSARFRVDDRELEPNADGFLELPSHRDVQVEAIIRDHHNVIQRFNGRANESLEWEVPLKPLPAAKPGEPYNPPYFDLDLVWIEPGRFKMGSPIDEFRRLPNEDNLTVVRLDYGYWIGAHEVDQAAYLHVMGENPSRFKGQDLPVESVVWESARLFCEKLTEFERQGNRLPEGYLYRLPTEAEWEHAARAGTETPFSFGDEAEPSKGNFHGYYSPGATVGKSAEDRYGTLPTGSFEPNAFGLHDVHGNVAEWTLDRYWDRHPGGVVTNPANTRRGRGYALRGGSWRDSADRVRSAAREGVSGSTVRNSIGFRIVLAPALDQLKR